MQRMETSTPPFWISRVEVQFWVDFCMYRNHDVAMNGFIVGFDWDDGNRTKCRKHGVPIDQIEDLFSRSLMIFPDDAHSIAEERYRAVGRTSAGRHVFIVFTIRTVRGERHIRPISARYMHAKEISYYEEENSDLPKR